MTKEKNTTIEKQLANKRFIVIIKALRTDKDYLRIVYIIYIKVLYNIIDFIQKTRQDRQTKKEIDLIILLKDSVYNRLKKQDIAELIVNKLVI